MERLTVTLNVGDRKRINDLIATGMFSVNTTLKNLMRYVNGDMQDIGDAFIAGETVRYQCEKIGMTSGENPRSEYSIDQKQIEVNGVKINAPYERSNIKGGQTFWFIDAASQEYIESFVYDGAIVDHTIIDRGMAFKTRDDAVAFGKAVCLLPEDF